MELKNLGTSLTKKEWKEFFEKVSPIIKGFQEYTKKLEAGDEKTRREQDKYNRKMDKKYKIKRG